MSSFIGSMFAGNRIGQGGVRHPVPLSFSGSLAEWSTYDVPRCLFQNFPKFSL